MYLQWHSYSVMLVYSNATEYIFHQQNNRWILTKSIDDKNIMIMMMKKKKMQHENDEDTWKWRWNMETKMVMVVIVITMMMIRLCYENTIIPKTDSHSFIYNIHEIYWSSFARDENYLQRWRSLSPFWKIWLMLEWINKTKKWRYKPNKIVSLVHNITTNDK